MNKVAFHTFGCKLNYSETSSISRIFKKNGFKATSIDDKPDEVIINTCSVTENADKKCKDLIKKINKVSPSSKITVVGCYAQLKPKKISNFNGVNKVLGIKEKFEFKNYLSSNKKIIRQDIKETRDFNLSYSVGDRTRSFLKIQDGCNFGCSFCTIPMARGRSRSTNSDNVIIKIKELVNGGSKEIVLSGINIGDFGIIEGRRKENFSNLINKIDKIKDKIRLRISSIEPNLLDDNIIELIAKSKKFVNHFHIPMQSGNDKILKLMSRKYDTNLYSEKIKKIKKEVKNSCIGADVIVGFPGETDNDFEKTLDFIKNLKLNYLHVFPYSERDNTRSKGFGDIVSKETKEKRSKILRSLSEKLKRNFYEKNINKKHNVLFENKKDENYIYGFTDNYVRVKVPYNKKLIGSVKRTHLYDIDSDSCVLGKII
jgi:threonylcarbamoyladenosine tRNA methylthiotransferase MtaB|tara:strand:+ start:3878 stop:5161 length:1284 start_codon:yes stop_codon:yes gene_type:complete